MFKKIFDSVLRAFEVYQIVTLPTVWAMILALMTGVLGWLDGLPLMYAFLGAIGAATMTIVATLRYDETKARLNPRDKLKITPYFWYLKAGKKPQYLQEIQIGCWVQNFATFPIFYRVTEMRTIFDLMTSDGSNIVWKDYELASLDSSYARDAAIKLKRKKLAQYDGILELKMEFWRAGRNRRYEKTLKYALEFRFDMPEAGMNWRPI